MKKAEINVGGLYTARVSGRYVTVRVDAIRVTEQWHNPGKEVTMYDVTNLTTGRKTTFRSAAKFRSTATTPVQGKHPTYEEALASIAANKNCAPSETQENGVDRIYAVEIRRDMAFAAVDKLLEGECYEKGSKPASRPTDSSPAATLTLGGSLASQIAAVQAAPTTVLTQEQESILEVAQAIQWAMRGMEAESEVKQVNGQWVLVIKAGAGAGKTFTLEQLEEVLHGIGQYTAFNASLVADSKAKFCKAACNTTHSLAFREVGRRFAHRLNGPRVKSYQIAAALGIGDMHLSIGEPLERDGDAWCQAALAAGYTSNAPPPEDFVPRATRRLKSSFLAGQVTETVKRFCQSADAKIGTKHFTWVDGIDEVDDRTNNDKVCEYLLPFAEKAWIDLSSETGTLPFNHDCYVKVWQLGMGPSRPMIAADYILLDEYQDTAPVFLDVLKQQTHALLIMVGDDNQRIYEWRGAVNAGDEYPGAPKRLLSKSFRFGQAVADVANSVLAGLEEPTDLVMRGLETIPSRVCQVEEPRCYLYRTNAGAVSRLMQEFEAGCRGHLIGGTGETVKFCRAALDLQEGRGTSHPELGCFQTWAEVQEYSREDEGQDLRLMVKLIDEFNAKRIIRALEDMPKEADADLVLSTAHRSKGREWATVRLGGDFPLPNKMGDAERRLVYVAATRAQEELDVSQCPTFMGGWDKQGGEDGDSAPAKWVPGIEVGYTAPMPTVEDLAAYRAAKKFAPAIAPAIAQESPAAGVPLFPAIAPADAAPAIVAQANGIPAGPRVGEFSWANMDGKWLVRGPANQGVGVLVTVRKKSGQTSQETLRGVNRKLGDLWFYEVK